MGDHRNAAGAHLSEDFITHIEKEDRAIVLNLHHPFLLIQESNDAKIKLKQ